MIGTKSFEDPLSEMYHALRAPRRRTVVSILSDSDEATITVRSLAREIAADEHSIPVTAASGEPYRNAYNALSQTHLPTLSSTGVIIYDPKRQKVSGGPNLAVASIIIEITRPTVTLLFDQLEEGMEEQTMTD
jgi:hydroxymethylpyrimidine pyrophosphatase-like HAD family hydrolase